MSVAVRSILLLAHHQLDHVALIHEFLALAYSIFALYYISVLLVKVPCLAVRSSTGANVVAHGPLYILDVVVVRFYARLLGECNVGRRFVRELWLVLLGQGEWPRPLIST